MQRVHQSDTLGGRETVNKVVSQCSTISGTTRAYHLGFYLISHIGVILVFVQVLGSGDNIVVCRITTQQLSFPLHMTINDRHSVLMVLVREGNSIYTSKRRVGIDKDIVVADNELIPLVVRNDCRGECYINVSKGLGGRLGGKLPITSPKTAFCLSA
jgi:hypothetical protein